MADSWLRLRPPLRRGDEADVFYTAYAALAHEILPRRDRALRRGRYGVGADALARGAAGGVGGADPTGVNEDEIRERVRLALAEALLPRDLPKLVHSPTPGQPRETLMETSGALNDRCVVCPKSRPRSGTVCPKAR